MGGNSVNVIYLFFQLLLFCACVVTCLVVQERPLTLPWRPLTAKMVLSAYSVNPAAELDFCWVLAGRLFFFVSASMQTFSYFTLGMLSLYHPSSISGGMLRSSAWAPRWLLY